MPQDVIMVPSGRDSLTGSNKVIDEEHHEIHAGKHFFYTDSATLNAAETVSYLLVTSSDPCAHMFFEADGTAVTTFQLYEGTDKTGSTLQVVRNNNRNYSDANCITIYKGLAAGGTTDGTLIRTYSSGVAAGANIRLPSSARNIYELVLRSSTSYIFRITSGTNGNLTNFLISWYDEEGEEE